MKGLLSGAVAAFPFSFADVLILLGFATLLIGLKLTFGLGPTLIVAGLAVLWIGGRLFAPSSPDKR